MRSIKFRAWLTSLDEMFEPNNKDLCVFNDGTFRVGALDCEGGILMQYTGLKDKNGIEIYEGDIISFDGNMTADNTMGSDPNGFIYDEDCKHLVIWDTDLYAWNLEFEDDQHWKYKRDTRNLLLDSGSIEVIGNIHEHPNLLKVKDLQSE